MSEPYWVPMTGQVVDYQGAWDPAISYPPGAVVTRAGVTYLAVNPSTNQQPPVAVAQLPGMVNLLDSVLGSAAPSFDLPNIPQTYLALRLYLFLRGDPAVGNTAVALRFNGDTGANYDSEGSAIGGTATASNFETLATASPRVGVCPGNTATAGYFGTTIIDIYNYAATVGNKQASGRTAYAFGTSTATVQIENDTVVWRTLATAINRLTVLPTPSGNFVAGSRATLYGIQ